MTAGGTYPHLHRYDDSTPYDLIDRKNLCVGTDVSFVINMSTTHSNLIISYQFKINFFIHFSCFEKKSFF